MVLVVVFYNVGFRVLAARSRYHGLMQFSALFPDDFALAKTFLCRERENLVSILFVAQIE